MDADRSEVPEPSSLSQDRRINEVCESFEAAWRAGDRPRIEDSLGATPEPERSALLAELLALELELRRDRGERPIPAEYHTRFPDHARLIDDAFSSTQEDTGQGGSTVFH